MAGLEAGRLLAERYLLQRRLGDGGHAEVWKARDERGGHDVALKFLRLCGEGVDDALPVLRYEARMAQRLQHCGVLRLYEPEQDGTFVFLPMEFAAGGDASRLRGMPWRRVLPVLLQTARMLEHAHARGVVHRDLKARNVLFDALGNVRVSDFGAAACTGSCAAPSAGSPFSASPQQLRDEPASPADDVYGLGALAHELLARNPPFYPHFDARRVQLEEPARLVPVHPAPPELLDLVQSMLTRAAATRPDLATVIERFERLLAPTAGRRHARSRQRALAAWIGGLMVVAGVAGLLWPRSPMVAAPLAGIPLQDAASVDQELRLRQ